jgi:ferredoxin
VSERLAVDIIKCEGHGYCAEIIPERIQLDDWGFPILSDEAVSPGLIPHARRAIAACPLLALRLEVERGKPG